MKRNFLRLGIPLSAIVFLLATVTSAQAGRRGGSGIGDTPPPPVDTNPDTPVVSAE